MSRSRAAQPATTGAPHAAPAVAAPAVARPPARLANALTRVLATWLERPDPARVRATVAGWGPDTWMTFRRVIVMHGLAPHLARGAPSSVVAGSLPNDVRAWLAAQDDLNAQRIRRMHADLGAILAAAAAAGIEVMPLKGALLTTMPGADPYRRPMADLDLLVHPPDRAPMSAILDGLGYRREVDRAPRPTHDVYLDPGGGRLVSTAGEHPDNPRRVEVHTEVKRHLWAWVDDDDLTAALWSEAERGAVLGEPATLPRPETLFAHLSIHASSDLLVGRGRLVQWVDLAAAADRAGDPARMPHARLAYPALRLAQRAQPGALAALDLGKLEARIPRRLTDWAATVALDGRCGLTMGRPPADPSGLGPRWERWRPDRWRLAVAYGDLPLPVALARHGLTIAGRARHRG